MSSRIEKFSQLFSIKEKQCFVKDPASLIPRMEDLQFEKSDVSIMKRVIDRYPSLVSDVLSGSDYNEKNDIIRVVSKEMGLKDDMLYSVLNDMTQAVMVGGTVLKDDACSAVAVTDAPLKRIGSGTVRSYGDPISVIVYGSGDDELFITDAGLTEQVRCGSLSCTFTYDDGTEYSGRIKVTDVRHMTSEDQNGSFGCIYRYHGKGKLTWANGDVYEGDFINDGRTGKGRYVWANGNVYEGDFVDDGRTGKGRFTWTNGDVYEGDFINDVSCGRGRMTWKDGSYYEGDFSDDEQNGIGTYVWTNGDVYIGDFVKNRRTGKGRFVWANRDVYEGDFVNNKRTGKGRFTFADGTIYVGDFVDNRFDGNGKMSCSDGSWYEGGWKRNEKDGDGIEHEPKSLMKKKSVRYKNGIRQ